MPERVLELGLAGFGHLARKYYVPALRTLGGVRISIVIDPLEASLEAARNAFPGIITGNDPTALLMRSLDGLIVASPPSTHLFLWNLAAQADLPVLLEKPFAYGGVRPVPRPWVPPAIWPFSAIGESAGRAR
jgi:predicted dehydrogenase